MSAPVKTPSFATENPSDPVAQAHWALRKAEYELFKEYAEGDRDLVDSRDFDQEYARLSKSTGMPKWQVDSAVMAYMALRELPRLRELQREYQRLDLPRLKAVSDAMDSFGENATPEVYAAVDEVMVEIFTPHRHNAALPTVSTIKRRINKLIADFDNAAAFCPENRKEREERPKNIPPGSCDVTFHNGRVGANQSGMTMMGDIATMAMTRAIIDATARSHGLTLEETVLKLLTGEITPSGNATVSVYAPKGPDGSVDLTKSVFFPGFGWTNAVGTEKFHSLAGLNGFETKNPATFVDLESTATHTVNGHDAPEKVKEFVRMRDGHCIFPGCTVPARRCQLDHRIAYEEGGPTTASNLYCLCQKHHNVKTDKRAFYLPDPFTGDIVWLFADGTYAITKPAGFLHDQVTPTAPRWVSTLSQVRRHKQKVAHFYAQAHKLIDGYEAGTPYPTTIEALEKLEQEYGLKFPFAPEPPAQEPDPDFEPPPEDDEVAEEVDEVGA